MVYTALAAKEDSRYPLRVRPMDTASSKLLEHWMRATRKPASPTPNRAAAPEAENQVSSPSPRVSMSTSVSPSVNSHRPTSRKKLIYQSQNRKRSSSRMYFNFII